MAVYGYTRVSTQSQSEEGLSLDTQRRQLEGYAMMQGFELDELFVEKGVSGWKPFASRPAGSRLTGLLKAGDIILCPKLDRLFRSARDALNVSDELKKRGVGLHLLDLGGDVTGNGMSKVFFTIIAAFAEFERDRIAERISDVKCGEKEKGRFLGGSRPFGYQVGDDGFLVADEREQQTLALMVSMHEKGKSLRCIADTLSSAGVRVSHMTVKKVLVDYHAHRPGVSTCQ